MMLEILMNVNHSKNSGNQLSERTITGPTYTALAQAGLAKRLQFNVSSRQ